MAQINASNVAQAETVYVKVEDRRARKQGETRVVHARKNGMVKTWKTRPDDFRAPFKYGLRDFFYITPDNCKFFYTTDAVPALRIRETLINIEGIDASAADHLFVSSLSGPSVGPSLHSQDTTGG